MKQSLLYFLLGISKCNVIIAELIRAFGKIWSGLGSAIAWIANFIIDQNARTLVAKIREVKSEAYIAKNAASIASGDKDYTTQIIKFIKSQKTNTPSLKGSLKARPKISIILCLKNVDPVYLKEAIDSVLLQIYDDWELIVFAYDVSDDVIGKICSYGEFDSRVKAIRDDSVKGRAEALNRASEKASGEWLFFFEEKDILHKDALIQAVRYMNHNDDLDVLYGDEEKFCDTLEHLYQQRKPGFDIELLLGMNYISNCFMIRQTVFDSIDGFRTGFGSAFSHDLLLRACEKTRRFEHIPIVFSYKRCRGNSFFPRHDFAPEKVSEELQTETKKAVFEYLNRNRQDAEVKYLEQGWFRVQYKIQIGHPRVSILIPFKDKLELLVRNVEKIEEVTTYDNYEIVLIDNNSETEEMKRYLENTPHTVVKYEKPFNFSGIYNYVVPLCDSEYQIFLNNDIEVITPDWIESFLEHAQHKDVACVGAKLFYPDGKLQHAGIVMTSDIYRVAFNVLEDTMYSDIQRSVSGVTAACLMTKKSVFEKVGGFDDIHFPIGFSDVDLCLRFKQAGYRMVFTPHVQCIHYESPSRGFVNENYEFFMINNKYVNKSPLVDQYFRNFY